MKKIISLILVSIIGISIIPKTLVNEKHEVLESSISVYTKEEVDSMLAALNNNITVNAHEITNLKNEITALNDSLTNYALKSDLSTTSSNIDDLNTIVADNTSRIDVIEEGKELIATAITNKGVETFNTDSFEIIASNIDSIQLGNSVESSIINTYTAICGNWSTGTCSRYSNVHTVSKSGKIIVSIGRAWLLFTGSGSGYTKLYINDVEVTEAYNTFYSAVLELNEGDTIKCLTSTTGNVGYPVLSCSVTVIEF